MKSFSLFHVDAQEKDDWGLRISRGQPANLGLPGKCHIIKVVIITVNGAELSDKLYSKNFRNQLRGVADKIYGIKEAFSLHLSELNYNF